MVVSCPTCREMVHVSSGYLVRHGFRAHGVFQLCSGSGSPYCIDGGSCWCF